MVSARRSPGSTGPLTAAPAPANQRGHRTLSRVGDHCYPASMPAGARVTPRTLPAPRSTLIPREREQQEIVRRLLDDQVRLLTLVGPPGAGKTRLAIMAATELAD